MKMDKATLGISPTRQAGGFMHNSSMLAVLSDCVIRCNDGDVRANTYALVQSCDVISNMFEDMGETDAPDDDRVFVIDRFSSRTMKFVVDLIQKSIQPSDVKSIEDARDVLVAMDFLCCTTRWKRMVDRLWTLVRASPACDTKRLLLDNAGFIVPEHPAAFFTKYRRMCPGWHEYKALFEAVPMTPETAILFVTQLMTYFPMPMIIHAIVSNTPKRQISNVVTGIFHIQRIGRYFHPEELLVAMDTIHLAASTKCGHGDHGLCIGFAPRRQRADARTQNQGNDGDAEDEEYGQFCVYGRTIAHALNHRLIFVQFGRVFVRSPIPG